MPVSYLTVGSVSALRLPLVLAGADAGAAAVAAAAVAGFFSFFTLLGATCVCRNMR